LLLKKKEKKDGEEKKCMIWTVGWVYCIHEILG